MNVSAKFSITACLPWALFLAFLNFFFVFLVWLANPDVLHILIPVILLFSLFLFLAVFFFLRHRERKQIQVLADFLENPTPESMQQALSIQTPALIPITRRLLDSMLRQTAELENDRAELMLYQEFIEEWTHNIKTPLSLATLVLNNHKEEMSSYVYQRMTHTRREIQDDVDMILYYARLQGGAHVEYRFEPILLPEFMDEILFNYREQTEETGISITADCPPLEVVSDRKILTFMLSQLLNNAFQYTPHENGTIHILGWMDSSVSRETTKIHLAVRDNGQGVPEEDIPFLFDKGFTGNHPDRRNATGMGLYLVAKYADALAIDVKVEEDTYRGHGFAIQLSFPLVS